MILSSTRSGKLHKALLVGILAFSMLAGTMSQTRADGAASTRNIILGGLALTAGIILYNNYEHKVAQANTVVGYTQDGGVVYGDGRVVYPQSGNTIVYLSNDGTRPCSFNGYYARCAPGHLYAYFPHGYQSPCWPPGHCKQYWKQHEGDDEQGNENQGNGHGNGHGDD